MSVMPTDRHAAPNSEPDSPDSASLSSALAALPLLDPPADGWLRLRASLEQSKALADQASSAPITPQARRLHPRWGLRRGPRLLAMAAVMALAALMVGLPDAWKAPPASPVLSAVVSVAGANPDLATAAVPAETGDDNSQTETLMAESARLQSVLSWTASSGRDAETLALELALVDRMQWIDYLLADPEATAATREVLWRERVELLTQRVALTQRDSLIAASDAATREATL